MKNRRKHSEKGPVKQGLEEVIAEPNKNWTGLLELGIRCNGCTTESRMRKATAGRWYPWRQDDDWRRPPPALLGKVGGAELLSFVKRMYLGRSAAGIGSNPLAVAGCQVSERT